VPMKTQPKHPTDYLRELGESGEGPHDLAVAALMMAALDHSEYDLEPYHGHLQEMAEHAHRESRLTMNAKDGARALAELLAGHFGYDGDRLAYDDPQNVNLISVIDRRRGMPVALGILYIHAASSAGFEASGLNSPGHFLLRIGLRGSQTFVDPFNGGAALERERFGAPPSTGTIATEDIHAIQPVTDADVLLRLQNNLKTRALRSGENVRAVEIVQRMMLGAPRRPELWLTKSGSALHNEAAFGVQGLKHRLN
jgi:regulator of sirC expression with transglutaminase-like and TPR domain